MPATFPSHLAAVLPLKLWRPRWFDGLALAIGSMAPDFAYALDGSWLERPFPGSAPLWKLAHSLPWFVAWALPVTLLLCPLIRRAAPVLASGAASLPFLPGYFLAHTTSARAILLTIAALLVAAAVTRSRPRGCESLQQ